MPAISAAGNGGCEVAWTCHKKVKAKNKLQGDIQTNNCEFMKLINFVKPD